MKVFRVAISILVVICIIIGIHSYVMTNMGRQIAEKNQEAEEAAFAEDWDLVLKLMNEVENKWEEYRLWAALTISTEDIEQLEISLSQAKRFAQIRQKADFFGEFVMFSKLVEHIPHREGFHIEEIL